MRAALLFLLACSNTQKTTDTSSAGDTTPPPEAEIGCAVWVLCCAHQCTTTAAYDEWAADPQDCGVECDTGSPGSPPGDTCALQDDQTCAWE